MTKRELFKIFKEAKVFSTFCMALSQISVAEYRGFLEGRPFYNREYKERGFLTSYFMTLEQLQDEKEINDLICHIKYEWQRRPIITIQQ